MDLVLNMPNDGIRLVFDSVSQRLKVQSLNYIPMLICSYDHESIIIFINFDF